MYKLLIHNGSIKKKVLKYGTPKPSLKSLEEPLSLDKGSFKGSLKGLLKVL